MRVFMMTTQLDPQKRPTFEQLREDPWLRQMDSWTDQQFNFVKKEMRSIDEILQK